MVDDVGWFYGSDDRHLGMPSRSGMVRGHVAEDWQVINEIGRRIDQRIAGAMVIGEWDKNNRMRGKAHMTPNPDEWDAAATLNMREAERCFAQIEESEYIDIALHGLLHSYWDEEMGHDDQQYYVRPRKGWSSTDRLALVPLDYFEDCVDTFLGIYSDWGFSRKITTFVSPGSAFGTIDDNRGFAKVLKDRGIKYWTNYWSAVKSSCEIIEGITFLNKGVGDIPWNAYDVNPAIVPSYAVSENDGVVQPRGSVLGLHWPNLLRFDAMKNLENVDAWVDFYRRQAECFGIIISRDMAFAAKQALYEKYTVMDFAPKEIILDFTAVDSCGISDTGNTVYISLKNHLHPIECEGGRISLYETHIHFRTYAIERSGRITKIKLK